MHVWTLFVLSLSVFLCLFLYPCMIYIIISTKLPTVLSNYGPTLVLCFIDVYTNVLIEEQPTTIMLDHNSV